MSSRLADQLLAARRRRFVGRAHELGIFTAALMAAELPFSVLYFYGPGGSGKTVLLGECAAICARQQIAAYLLDARYIEPDPDMFVGVLQHAMGLTPPASPFLALATTVQRQVILIDTAELLTPVERWLYTMFLPQLPEHVLVVIAGRNPPALEWRTDAGWQAFLRIMPLGNLSSAESQAYLELRQVPADQHQAVLNFTHGHPLALSLVADVFAQRGNIRFQPEAAPDVIKTLLEQFVQQVPGPAHRTALEVCALVRLTNETLLAEMLHMPDVHELFAWLRGLSFIEAEVQGLFPHDLAREALDADLRWRHPAWYAELHQRARTFYNRRLQQSPAHEQQRILADYIFLHRNNAVVRPFFEWQASGGMRTDVMHAVDQPALLAMVEQHEGAESAGLAAYWFAQQPAQVLVLRDPDRRAAGFLMLLALDQLRTEERLVDPATQAVWQFLQTHAPLRAGECATFFRFWMASDHYQAVSPVQSLIFINIVRHYLITPGLAFTFFPCAEPDFWLPMLSYANLTRIAAADFRVGDRAYGVYGHDWRLEPPVAWLGMLAERELGVEMQPALVPAAPTVTILSETDFVSAVRDALHHLNHHDGLRNNPLLRSRLITGRSGPAASDMDRIVVLQELLGSACDALQASPRDRKAYRALYHTYIQPAPTQEQAAELLDLPFSTFRRHLRTGIARITEMLWEWELKGWPMNNP